ncbi:MAG TPA: hypothetical protein VGQ67_16400, partial [Candidatus Polarisedimenticolia bacterium]|nr:hypothetical protein [Candidatus Polarisedimenticolia bacterium]
MRRWPQWVLLLAVASPAVADARLPAFEPGWEQRTFWDLRAYALAGDAALAQPGAVSGMRPIARGIALLPAGPREVGLFRETAGGRRRYRFVAPAGAPGA